MWYIQQLHYIQAILAGKAAYFRGETILAAALVWKMKLFLVLIYNACNLSEHVPCSEVYTVLCALRAF